MIKLLHKVASNLWKIFNPVTVGVRILLVKDGKILLVRHSYSSSWYLPGGGLKPNETFQQAIERELQEELGIQVSELKLHGVYNNFFEGKSDSIIVFSSSNFSEPSKTSREIETFGFFEINNLPENTSPGTNRRIIEYLKEKSPYHTLW